MFFALRFSGYFFLTATATFFDEHQKFMRFAEYDNDTNKTIMHCMAKQSKENV